MNKEEIQKELDKIRNKERRLLNLFLHDKIDRKKAEEVYSVLKAKREAIQSQV